MADNIDIKLKLDGEKEMRSSLKNVNTELKTMQSELKLVETATKGQANSAESLQKKVDALAKVSESAAKKQQQLSKFVEEAKKKQEDAKKAVDELKSSGTANAEQIEKAEKDYQTLANRVNYWQTELNKATTEQIKADQELQKAEGYLKEANSAADGLATSIDAYGKEAKDSTKETEGLNQQVGALTQMEAVSKIAEKASEAFKKLNEAASAAAKELDQGYDTIIKKTGSTGESFNEMQDIANDLFGSMPVQMDDVGSAIGEVNTRFKLTGKELSDTSKIFVQFAKINDTDVSNAVDDVQNAMAAFNVDASKASKVLDVLTRTGQNTGANVANLSKKITENATAFQEMGLDIYQAISFMGGLETAGADASSVLSGLKRALKAATEEGKPLNSALAELEESIRNGTESTDGLTIAYDLFGKSGAGVFQAVKNGQISFSDLTKTTDILSDSVGSLERTFEATLSPWDKWTVAQNNLKIAGSELSNQYQQALTPAVESLSGIVHEATERFKELPESAQTAIAVIGGIGGKALEIGPQIASLVTQIAALKIAKSVAGTTDTFASSLKKLAGPAGIAAGAITAVVLVYEGYRKKLEWATQAQQELLDSINGVSDGYKTTHSRIQTLVSDQNEYRSREERIAELESMRAGIVDTYNESLRAKSEAENELIGIEQKLDAAAKDLTASWEMGDGQMVDYTYDADSLRESQKKLNETIEEAGAVAEMTNSDLDLINATLAELQAEEDAAANAVTDANSRINNSRDASISKIGEELTAFNNLSSYSQTMAVTVSDAILEMHETITGSIQGLTSWFDAVEERSAQSADVMAQNLAAQIEDIKMWESNLAFLANQGINDELLKYLADMGPSGAAYVQAFVDAANGKTEVGLGEMNRLWQEKLELEKGINSEAEEVYSAIGEIAAGSKEAFEALKNQLNAEAMTSGEGVSLGMAEGIRTAMDQATAAAEELGEGTTKQAAAGAQTNSPSRATRQTGQFVSQGMRDGINAGVPAAKAAAENLGKQVINGAKQSASAVSAQTIGQAFANAFTQSIRSSGAAAFSAGFDVANLLAAGVSAQSGSVYAAAANLSASVSSGINPGALRSRAYDAGLNVDSGLAQGIMAGRSMAINAAAIMAQNVIDTARNTLKIHSPSEVFEEMGEFSVAGYERGVEKTINLGSVVNSLQANFKPPDYSRAAAAAGMVNEVRVYIGDKELSAVLTSGVIQSMTSNNRAYLAGSGRR